MGWSSSPSWYSREKLVKTLTESDGRVINDKGRNLVVKSKTLKHCLRGNVLWSVVENIKIDLLTSDFDRYNFIRCDLLQNFGKEEGWGYKPMDESFEPFYYTCPISYLKITKILSQKWRDQVLSKHADKTFKPPIGKIVKLKNCNYSYLKITAVRGSSVFGVGRYLDDEFRIPSRFLTQEVYDSWEAALAGESNV